MTSMNVENVIILVVLALWMVQDVKTKTVGLKGVIIVGVISLIYGVIKWLRSGGSEHTALIMAGVVFVVFLLVMSVGIKALGLGDMVILCMLMAVKGVVFVVCTFMGAVTIMAVVCVVLMLIGRVKRKDSVAFVPFIWVAALGVMICV